MSQNFTVGQEALLKVAAQLLQFPQVPTGRLDIFTPGLYIRALRMPANSVFVSEMHKTQHPFFVMFGELDVWSEETGWKRFRGGDFNITNPGTQRLLQIYQETVWITVHATDVQPEDESPEAHERAVQTIVDRIIEQVDNPFIEEMAANIRKKRKFKKREAVQ